MTRSLFVSITLIFSLLSFGEDSKKVGTHKENEITSGIIEISSENPFYWQINGKPTLLLGGTKTHNLFQIPDLEEHLDLLTSVGGNYVRCVMSSRESGDEMPYLKNEELYDLNEWNPSYWNKFEKLISLTAERDIVVQIELWATYDFYQRLLFWEKNPFNPINNSTYTEEESGIPEIHNESAQMKINPFFETVPSLNNNTFMLKFQEAFIDKILSYTFKYNHVLYCIDNETDTQMEWALYWSNYLRIKSMEAGKRIYITEMWNNWDPTDGKVPGIRSQNKETHNFLDRAKVANTIDNPDIFDFVEISNHNTQEGEVHYLTGLFVRDWIKETGIIRPINNVKIYGGTRYNNHALYHKHGEERFWRNIFAGHATARFHRPTSGIGLSPIAQQHILSMRMLTDSMDFFKHEPANNLLHQRLPNEAFCLAIPGKEYAIYFPAGGEVRLEAIPGEYEVDWLHIRSSNWYRTSWSQNPAIINNPDILKTPDNDQWVVLLKRRT